MRGGQSESGTWKLWSSIDPFHPLRGWLSLLPRPIPQSQSARKSNKSHSGQLNKVGILNPKGRSGLRFVPWNFGCRSSTSSVSACHGYGNKNLWSVPYCHGCSFYLYFPVLVRAAFSFSVFFPGRQDLFGLICGCFGRVRIVVRLFVTLFCHSIVVGLQCYFGYRLSFVISMEFIHLAVRRDWSLIAFRCFKAT